ncbi:hypothetical protein [Maribacter sp. HTCC2170]|uniref:hypothetical protein n=1 Tax=Maribacter sp. (strain HTCC2170 / KCCM 42371) TaxID=313603 RepID=UPI00006B49B6|nr:hypothetical protein [Maribacter sp. HTCC2170]EAR00916.1 hypothetical protein FB2170_09101 [Maribacter sp. HTCC2170]
MNPKFKAMFLNFLGFAILFIIARVTFGYLLSIDRLYLALMAAVFASVLAPKFAVADIADSKKVMMKWIFIKGFREI